jgi:hypothetical protein
MLHHALRLRPRHPSRDFESDLTPQRYLDVAGALADAGYNGDSKVSTQSGDVRFLYNQVIIHAHSRGDAYKAERVAQQVFGAVIIAHGRGFDIVDASRAQVLDWHSWLCANDPLEGPLKLRPKRLHTSRILIDVLAFAERSLLASGRALRSAHALASLRDRCRCSGGARRRVPR